MICYLPIIILFIVAILVIVFIIAGLLYKDEHGKDNW